MDNEWELEGDESARSAGEREPPEIAGVIGAADPTWEAGGSIELGDGQAWKPDLVRKDRSALLHVHVADRLRGYATKRFAAALDSGVEVHVATTLGRLYNAELLEQLAAVDAHVHLIDGPLPVEKAERVLALLADLQIRVPPALRTSLANHGWDMSSREGTSHQKGKRFEALVAFLLSQVDGFSVFERNYRTDTEEIDAVVRRGELSERVWSLANAPFILAEAKNHKDGISQGMFSQFRLKMMTKRATVRIGLMFSRTSVSGDATEQEKRFASEELTIAFLDGDAIEKWIEAQDGTEYLDRLISEAMLG